MDKNSEKKVLLRLPLRLWSLIVKGANKNSRSINGEIVNALKEKFKV